MNNAEKFKQVFGLYATELWSMPEGDFLEWLNRDVETTQIDHTANIGKKVSIPCAHENDLIFRQAAIDALARMMPRSYTPDGSHPADEEIFRAQEVFADCIEALEILPSAQPATNCSEIPNGSDDTISRRAAIEKMEMLYRDARDDTNYMLIGYNHALSDMQAILKSLPSAQPDNQINLCDSCDYLYPECPAKNDDVIFGNGIGNDNICACNKYKPSAQPERKKGTWIPFDIPWYRCSNCGAVRENIAFMEYFCPNCGADMRKERRG